MKTAAFTSCALLVAITLSAQTPSPRIGHVMTTAGASGGVYLLGGAVPGVSARVTDSLWLWNGTSWRPLGDGAPHARGMPAAAFDTRRNTMVVFGGAGIGSGTLYGDLWEFD